MDVLKAIGKWLALVAVLVAALVGGALWFLYSQLDPEDLPQYQVSFNGAALEPTGYHWTVPVAGDWLHRTFSLDGDPVDLGLITVSHPAIELPRDTQMELIITDEAGETVFQGDATAYQSFSLGQNGSYSARLTVSPRVDTLNPTTRMEGWYLYEFTFELQAQLVLTLSHTSGCRLKSQEVSYATPSSLLKLV